MSDYYIEIKYEVTEVRHTRYCSDVEDPSDVPTLVYRKTKKEEDPDPEFVKSCYDKSGKVDDYGLRQLSRVETHHNINDCSCGLNRIIWKAISATLKKKSNIRSKFLSEDYSSGEE